MKRRLLQLVVFLLLGAIVNVGCGPSRNYSKFQTQVERWIPDGTPIATAESRMRAKGFKTSYGRNRSGEDYLYCTRETVILPIPIGNREWRVIAYIADECVIRKKVHIFVHAL
jgi:hypothetical protein